MSVERIVQVERISKKFCTNLKRSLLYGLKDMIAEFRGRDVPNAIELRPGEFLAVNDVSFDLKQGECLGLIGPNGAGKSTVLKMLNGLIRPDAGQITVRGRVGGLIELGAGFNPILSGRENVYINGAVLGFSRKDIDARFDEIVNFAELQDFIDAPVQSYSSGMRVRLGMGVAINLRAHLLLVDEVLAVGDYAFRVKCFQHFLKLKKAGSSIVLVSHNMIDVNRICDRVIVMDHGRKAHDGDVSAGTATYEGLGSSLLGPMEERAPDAAAWIERIELQNSRRVRTTEFLTGDDLIGEVTVATRQHVQNARLVVHVVASSLGPLGSFSSPHKGFTFDISPPGVVVRFAIRNMPLLVGSYTLMLNLYGPEVQDFMHALKNAATFKIIGPPVDTFGYGVCHTVLFEHDWEVGENAAPTPRSSFDSRQW